MIEIIPIMLTAIPDLLIKTRIENMPESCFPHRFRYIPLTLRRHHNYGFAHNRLQHRPHLVRTAVTLLYLLFYQLILRTIFRSGSRSERMAAVMMLGGGLSNLADRLRRGYVVDYLHFHIPRLNRVIMNIGDILLFIGSGILVIINFISDTKPRDP